MLRSLAVYFLAALICRTPCAAAPGDACSQLAWSEPRNSKDNWGTYQARLASEVATADAGQGWDVLFSGGSIFEYLRGSVVGRPWSATADYATAFHDQIAARYNSHILGISGDSTSNLLWRVTRGGEMPARQPKVVVLYIGSNDISAADCAGANGGALLAAVEPLLARVRAIVHAYREAAPAARVLLLGLMPRAGRYWEPSERSAWPNAYTGPLEAAIAASDPMLTYQACGQELAPNLARLTSDGIHPTAEGYRLILGCWRAAIDELMAEANASAAQPAAAPSNPGTYSSPGPRRGVLERPRAAYDFPDLPGRLPDISPFGHASSKLAPVPEASTHFASTPAAAYKYRRAASYRAAAPAPSAGAQAALARSGSAQAGQALQAGGGPAAPIQIRSAAAPRAWTAAAPSAGLARPSVSYGFPDLPGRVPDISPFGHDSSKLAPLPWAGESGASPAAAERVYLRAAHLAAAASAPPASSQAAGVRPWAAHAAQVLQAGSSPVAAPSVRAAAVHCARAAAAPCAGAMAEASVRAVASAPVSTDILAPAEFPGGLGGQLVRAGGSAAARVAGPSQEPSAGLGLVAARVRSASLTPAAAGPEAVGVSAVRLEQALGAQVEEKFQASSG